MAPSSSWSWSHSFLAHAPSSSSWSCPILFLAMAHPLLGHSPSSSWSWPILFLTIPHLLLLGHDPTISLAPGHGTSSSHVLPGCDPSFSPHILPGHDVRGCTPLCPSTVTCSSSQTQCNTAGTAWAQLQLPGTLCCHPQGDRDSTQRLTQTCFGSPLHTQMGSE